MIFLSAQTDHPYYHWQLEVMILNFMRAGINPNHIEAVFSYKNNVSAAGRALANAYPFVRVFFYKNSIADDAGYPSICRPHVLAQHFDRYPKLASAAIFYHDCDILFRTLPDLSRLEAGEYCHLSDTISYIGARYLQKKGADLLAKMAGIVGIDPEAVIANQRHSGGAQYVLKGIDPAFWRKVESDCSALYRYLRKREEDERKTLSAEALKTYNPVQKWCADMWCVLWNLWARGKQTRIDKSLSFSWPTSQIKEWDKHNIFHNAGVGEKLKSTHFYKGEYIHKDPFAADLTYVRPTHCSWHYAQAIAYAREERKRYREKKRVTG
jgi:hypothetical protein